MPIHEIYIKSNKSDFKYILDKPVKGVHSIFVSNVKIPISYYNVNTNNNKLNFKIDNNLDYEIILPVGNYTTTSIIDKINQDIKNIPYNPTLTHNQINGKATFQVDNLHTISITPNQGIGKLLGFTKTQTSQSVEGNSIINLLHNDIFILVKNVSIDAEISDEKLNGKRANVLFHSNVNVPGFSVFVDNNIIARPKELIKVQNINNLDFLIMNQNFEQIDLNGLDFSFKCNLIY